MSSSRFSSFLPRSGDDKLRSAVKENAESTLQGITSAGPPPKPGSVFFPSLRRSRRSVAPMPTPPSMVHQTPPRITSEHDEVADLLERLRLSLAPKLPLTVNDQSRAQPSLKTPASVVDVVTRDTVTSDTFPNITVQQQQQDSVPTTSPQGSLLPPNAKSSLYKTELCRSFEETGHCRYGSKCQFAHGSQELRPVARHPKYKTVICRTFWERGECPYGRRCCFVHHENKGQLTLNERGEMSSSASSTVSTWPDQTLTLSEDRTDEHGWSCGRLEQNSGGSISASAVASERRLPVFRHLC